MKKLYYSLIILLVVVVGLVLPKAKAAGEFDDTAHYIGFIEDYETEVINGNEYIIGAWVYIEDSSLPVGDFLRYYFFTIDYFQPDLTVLADEMIGKTLIWNPFDKRGTLYYGAWWLLVGYEHISDDISDAYEYGYESGYNNGYNAGEQVGYTNGYGVGYDDGLEDGLDIGFEAGELQGWDDGYDDGYRDGVDDGREQVLNSIESIDEILYQDVVLPNGVQDEIINNEILVDRVGKAVFDGTESWNRYGSQETSEWQTIAFRCDLILENSGVGDIQTTTAISSHFLQMRGQQGNPEEDRECFFISESRLYVRIFKTRLDNFDEDWTAIQKINAFKLWLAEQKTAENSFTVWYRYAELEQYDLISLLRNEDGSFKDGYSKGYNDGRVTVQRENKSLLSVIPTTIGAVWLMISDFLSYEVFGLNLWSIIIMFASFSLLVLIIKMVI